jgi:hypothetical protein
MRTPSLRPSANARQGDIERRLPTARMKVVQITGGSTGRQLKMDVSFETPIFNLAAADAEKPSAK